MLTPLKFHRLSQQIKALELAKRAKISSSLLSKIETGKIKASRKTRKKLSNELSIPEAVLF
jgi:transcriptional regulator with XRE-family HTH domain